MGHAGRRVRYAPGVAGIVPLIPGESAPTPRGKAGLQIALPLTREVWIETRDGDPSVRAVFDRHYSRLHYTDGRQPALFCGPGEKMVLRTHLCDAIFVWRRFRSRDLVHGHGVNCAVFRREASPVLASTLIRLAVAKAWERWGKVRLYTYVNPRKVRSRNPGYCFRMAGWRKCGVTQGGLDVWELVPE